MELMVLAYKAIVFGYWLFLAAGAIAIGLFIWAVMRTGRKYKS